MAEPIAVRVTRYRCPHCNRSHSARPRAREHMARCWQNPDAKGCKTCKHFYQFEERCDAGVDLSGRPECKRCGGYGSIIVGADNADLGGVEECPECSGDGAEIKPGPIVGCEKWEAD